MVVRESFVIKPRNNLCLCPHLDQVLFFFHVWFVIIGATPMVVKNDSNILLE